MNFKPALFCLGREDRNLREWQITSSGRIFTSGEKWRSLHHPMKPVRLVPLKLASHGLALLIGCSVALALKDDLMTTDTDPNSASEGIARSSRNNTTATAWLDESLKTIRKASTDDPIVPVKISTIEEFLRENREDAEIERKEISDAINGCIAESSKYANLTNPLHAIRRSMLSSDPDANPAAIFSAWLDKDPDAALAELSRNWKLQGTSYLSSLLERRFGKEWLKQQVLSDESPYRLRKILAERLGQNLGWDSGLEGFMDVYDSIPDSRLKLQLTNAFSYSWPKESPEATSKFLKERVSPELRDYLLSSWSPMNFGCGMGGSFIPMPESAAGNWLDQVKQAISPEPAPLEVAVPDEPVLPAIQDDSDEDEFLSSLSSKVSIAIDEGSDLVELFSEGKISRENLLSELTLRIPGSEAYPNKLSRIAWEKIADRSDPVEVAAWATKLGNAQELEEVVINNFFSCNLTDPRMVHRLSLYRELAPFLSEGNSSSTFFRWAIQSFETWKSVSPATAMDWRNSLQANDRLRQALEKGEDEP